MDSTWPIPKSLPLFTKPFNDCKYWAENGLLYMNDGYKEQILIASFRIAGRSSQQEKEIADFAALCMNSPARKS